MKAMGNTVRLEFGACVLRRSFGRDMLFYPFMLLMLISIHGCIFNDNTKSSPDKGTYTIAVSDSSLSTYPGGGGVSIVEMIPSEDFEGSGEYKVSGFSGLHAMVNRKSVSMEKRITELVIYPDSTVSTGLYKVTLLHTHGGKTDTLLVPVTISKLVLPTLYTAAKEIVLPEFIDWSRKNYPPLNAFDYDNTFIYAITNMGIGGGGIWILVNNEWEAHFKWTSGGPQIYSWFLFRRMGEREPAFCLVKDISGGFTEWDIKDFFGYSHVWKEKGK